MSAETLSGTRAAATFRNRGGMGMANGVLAGIGGYEIAAVVEDGDIFELFRIPIDSVALSGEIRADDIDTGTEALDMDVGWNGGTNSLETADPDGLGNLGVWSGDAVTDIKPEVTNWYPLGGVLRTAGFHLFLDETMIQIEANAASNGGHTGTVMVVLYYIIDPNFTL